MSQHYKKGKLSISEMDLYDVPMLGIFAYDKTYTAYTLKVLAGIDVENPSTLEVRVEDFLSNLDMENRSMRMDTRVNIRDTATRLDIEIQRARNKDEMMRAIFYAGGLATDFPKGMDSLPTTKCIVILICDFDPFEGTELEGQTRFRFALKSLDDTARIHTIAGADYPFDAINVILYNGKQDWKKNPPKSMEEDLIRIYLEDMHETDPGKMQSQIASDAIKTYKGDPSIMDKTKEWINYNFEAELDEQRKKYDAIIEKQAQDFDRRYEEQASTYEKEIEIRAQDFDRRYEEQASTYEKEIEKRAQDFDRRYEEQASELAKANADFLNTISGLLKKGFGIKEISEITNLSEERILELTRNK